MAPQNSPSELETFASIDVWLKQAPTGRIKLEIGPVGGEMKYSGEFDGMTELAMSSSLAAQHDGYPPGSLVGVECAAIFAIFTSQAWNMAFSLYQSLKTLPSELDEASRSMITKLLMGGTNVSAVHWDMVLIQRPEWGGGEIRFDGELIRKDGLFVPKDLTALNPANLRH